MNAPAIATRSVPLLRPLHWLRLGWDDLHAAPGASLLHGLLIALGGLTILTLTLHAGPLMPGAFTGFVLVGPIICTGLYELSRRRLAGERPSMRHVFGAWRSGARPLVLLGAILLLAATTWVLFSALLFSTFAAAAPASPRAFLRYAVIEQSQLLFWLWALAGGLGAAVVFAVTVVSAPLLLDRRVGLRAAVAASVQAVADNALPMALWAALIMALTLASMATVMVGFVFAVPVIGHATWHAYRDLIDASALPPRAVD